jgi:hypothetical protein
MKSERELKYQQRAHRQFERALIYDRNALVVLGLFGGWIFAISTIDPATANWALNTLSWFGNDFTPRAGSRVAETTPISLIQSRIVAQLYALFNVVFICFAIIYGTIGALAGAVSVLETRMNTPKPRYSSNPVTRSSPESGDTSVEQRLQSNQRTLWRKQQAWNSCTKSIYSGSSHATIGGLVLFLSVYGWPYSLAAVCCLLVLQTIKIVIRIRQLRD